MGVVVANLAATIFLLTSLNDPASQAPNILAGKWKYSCPLFLADMFPQVVITAICATRMQRDVLNAQSSSRTAQPPSPIMALRLGETNPRRSRVNGGDIELRVTIHVEQHEATEISLDVIDDHQDEQKYVWTTNQTRC